MNKMDNNYSRPDGQNTGNFITDKPSSRVIHNPGGGSSICLGNADDEPRAAKHISHLKKKDIAGSGIFAPQEEVAHSPSAKAARGPANGIFDEHAVEEVRTSPMSYSRQKSVAAAAGSDIFGSVEDGDPLTKVVGGVRKPPGGGSSIVF